MVIGGLSISNILLSVFFMLVYLLFLCCIISCLLLAIFCMLKYLGIFDVIVWYKNHKNKKCNSEKQKN